MTSVRKANTLRHVLPCDVTWQPTWGRQAARSPVLFRTKFSQCKKCLKFDQRTAMEFHIRQLPRKVKGH